MKTTLCKVHKENNVDETWSIEQIKSALKKDLNVYEAAFTELGYLEEDQGNLVEASRWFLICEFLCESDEGQHSIDALAKLRHKMRGADLSEASQLAREWIKNLTLQVPETEDLGSGENKSVPLNAKGDVFAVLFGAEDYEHWGQLGTPLNDIFDFGATLEKKFNAIVDYVENPYRADITKKLNELTRTLKPDDHLISYFAGHGYLDEQADEGFWVPVNGEIEDDTDWISNAYLKRKIRKIQANNIW